MGISAVALTAAYDNTDLDTYTTASISPTTKRLIIAVVYSAKSAAVPATPTLSGCSLTWTQLRTDPSTARRLTLFYALTTGATSGTVSIAHGASSGTIGCGWLIDEFLGTDLSGTNGINAIIQHNAAVDSTAGLNINVTLNNFVDSINNVAFCAVTHSVAEGTTPALTTELHDVNGTAPAMGFESEAQVGQATSITPSWATSGGNRIIQALELKSVGALIGSPHRPSPRLWRR